MKKKASIPSRIKYNRLAEIIAERKITQEALAEDSGVTQREISLYKTGKREPSLPTLYKIAKALKVDPCELLNR